MSARPKSKKTPSAKSAGSADEPAVTPSTKEPAVKEPAAVKATPPEPVKATPPEPAKATPPEPAKPVRTKKETPLDIAAAKYIESGWSIIKPPKGAVNDFMASRGTRLHFVQVVTKTTIEEAKFHGEAKNNFVQNAFSNGAVPIFAHVVEGSRPKVTFEDVNTGNRALISSRTKKSEGEK
jgi:hypothetical protein